ncbi:asparagine synthetase B family protein [Halomonas organivorans]|uniref:asparagine synthase (glutamine-hydrolyzing) n=1 Tax=Halomonas organivorans TaxID=257772 RepID=A0A7W5BVU9_9GAMM|nr:asparagine synthetase B family protein [Halomonas organivorans]MBB3140056.1 asparagine synthase (glutamine-hydrolyzing) [Halomonas organivorans]
MCGILFCKVLDKTLHEAYDIHELLTLSLEKMQYRGRDNVALKEFKGFYFGHARLAINGLNESGNQPMEDDRHVLLFNGEYYNYKERCHGFESDTQALFHYLKSDPGGGSSIDGPYGYAWHDKETGETIFRRDVFGEKPLYYYMDSKVFLVASTLKSIVCIVNGLGGKVGLNIDALRFDYVLSGFIREPETVWKEVFEIPPGCSLIFTRDEVVLKRENFQLFCGRDREMSDSYFRNSFLSRDVEAALLLSSGVDSSYLLLKSVESNVELSLVTYGNDDGKGEVGEVEKNLTLMNLDERAYQYSALINNASDRKSLAEELEYYANIMEQPTADGLQVCRLLKHLKEKFPKLKVVYSGLGGDEIFGGYPSFRNFNLINTLVFFPGSDVVVSRMRRFIDGKRILGEWNVLVYYFLYRTDPAFVDLSEPERLRTSYERFKKGVHDALPVESLEKYACHSGMQIKFCELFDYCKNQLLRDMDNISIYNGLEARVPLLNPYFLEAPVDKKKGLKDYVKSKSKISFGRKKGFSVLDQDCSDIYEASLYKNRDMLENVLGEEVSSKFSSLDTGSLRKFSVLSEWLQINVCMSEAGLVAK